MKLRFLILGAAGALSIAVIFMALLTIFSLHSLETLGLKNEQWTLIRAESLTAQFHVVQIQQFLTDASATGDEGGIEEAQTHLKLFFDNLNTIENQKTEVAKNIDEMKKDATELFNVGKEMAHAYISKGRDAGNEIMKRPNTGLDALSEKLNEKVIALQEKVTQLQDQAEETVKLTQHNLYVRTIWLAVIEFIVMIGSFIAIMRRTNPLDEVIVELTQSATELESASSTVSTSANDLSAASSQQAAATHQTAASLEEIRAMVGKTSDNSRFLQARAEETTQSVQSGKMALDEVRTTIDEIHESQKGIIRSVEQTNEEIGKIVNLISEIGTKTKVIDEIVFQTKLLSFNASVEAARAGEHGKGFAVVAEEVGSLAQMSGNASREISDLLEGSIGKVTSIVEDGRNRLEQTIADSSIKIETSIEKVRACGESFEKIVTQMEAVNSTTIQTSSAIQETVKGLDEIAKAVEELDQSTRSNSEISGATSNTSLVLKNQVSAVKHSVDQVHKVVGG